MASVRFSASGYGSTESRYRTRRAAVCAVEREVGEMAADHGLDPTEAVFRGPDEWTLSSRSGEEIARWEIF